MAFEDNMITSIPSEIAKLTSLTYINMSGNRLTSLPTEIGLMVNLKNIIIGYNYLTAIPTSFANLKNLDINHRARGSLQFDNTFVNCSEVRMILGGNSFANNCKQENQLTCSQVGCNAGVPVCEEDEDGVCGIQCGDGMYRNGEWCSYCHIRDPRCIQCNTEGCSLCQTQFGISSGRCTACTGNSWSNGTTGCQEGPSNCSESLHDRSYCVKCDQGFGLEDGMCKECPTEMYSSDGITCRPVTKVDYCIAYSSVTDKCIKCSDGLLVGHDNKCRNCIDGEFATDEECVLCGEDSYSIIGRLNCTSECDDFTQFVSICIATGFCKVVNGECVPSDDNSFVITVSIGGSLAAIAFLLAVVLLVLWRVGWLAKCKAKKLRAKIVKMELAGFDTDNLEIELSTSTITFGGQYIPCGESASERLTIENMSRNCICCAWLWEESDLYTIAVDNEFGEIGCSEQKEFVVSFIRRTNDQIRPILKLIVFEKREQTNGKMLDLPILLRERAPFEIIPSELTFENVVGTGSFGTVYRGKYNGADVAIKQTNLTDEASQLFEREVEMLRQVRGHNVVVFHGALTTEKGMFHVTEFMDLGSLDVVLKKFPLNGQLKVKIAMDIAVGMHTVHSFGVIHRDLKPENVLCKSPLDITNGDMCKITDFGTSRGMDSVFAMTMTKGRGTPLYMAPELLAGHKRYSKAVDVYSYGILCAVVWHDGCLPYAEYNFQNPLELQNAIITGIRPELRDAPEEFVQLISQCWSGKPEERPLFDYIAAFWKEQLSPFL